MVSKRSGTASNCESCVGSNPIPSSFNIPPPSRPHCLQNEYWNSDCTPNMLIIVIQGIVVGLLCLVLFALGLVIIGRM